MNYKKSVLFPMLLSFALINTSCSMTRAEGISTAAAAAKDVAGTVTDTVSNSSWSGYVSTDYLKKFSAEYSQKALIAGLCVTVSFLAWQGWQSWHQNWANEADDYYKGLLNWQRQEKVLENKCTIKENAARLGGAWFYYKYFDWRTSLELLVDEYIKQLEAKNKDSAQETLNKIHTCLFAQGRGNYYMPKYQ